MPLFPHLSVFADVPFSQQTHTEQLRADQQNPRELPKAWRLLARIWATSDTAVSAAVTKMTQIKDKIKLVAPGGQAPGELKKFTSSVYDILLSTQALTLSKVLTGSKVKDTGVHPASVCGFV